MFVQFVCFLENSINLGWRVRHKSVSEHLSVPALKQHADPSVQFGKIYEPPKTSKKSLFQIILKVVKPYIWHQSWLDTRFQLNFETSHT